MGAITNAVGRSVEGIQKNLQDPGGALKDPVGQFKRGSLTQQFLSGDPSGPQAPGSDPKAEALANKRIQLAEDYRKNLENTKLEAGNISADSIRRDVSQGFKDIDKGANSRGLLYSGLPLGEKANLMASGASRQASAQASANRTAEEEANRLDANASGAIYNQSNQGLTPKDIAFNTALERQKSTNEALGAFGNAAGKIAASSNKNKQSPNQFYSDYYTSYPASQNYVEA